MSQQEEMKNLSLLGNKETNYIFDYQPDVLESFDNRHVENDYFIKFNCPEFTSLCPITAQPDFATIYISYILTSSVLSQNPSNSTSLATETTEISTKTVSTSIGKRLGQLARPSLFRSLGEKFTPRGGISIDPYYNYGKPGTKYEGLAEQRLFQHDLYPEKIDNR